MALDRSQIGRRYSCFSCGCKFYDLNRPEPLCPRCGANQLDDPAPDPRVAAMALSRKAKLAAKAEAEATAKKNEPEVDDDFDSLDLDNIDDGDAADDLDEAPLEE